MGTTSTISTQQASKEGIMDTDSISQQDKQITVDVPEARVPEFYAWYARFLAGRTRRGGGPGGHRGGPGGHRGRHDHGRRCGPDGPEGRERRDEDVSPGYSRHDG